VEQISATCACVRDTIPHSWDIQGTHLTRTASEVLQQKTGMCSAKAHLLAALLRTQGTPAGFCSQRLTRGDTPESGSVIHGLNAVSVSSIQKWVRLDARGNKPGVQTEFSLEGERLAYSVRPELGEIDDPTIYAQPHPTTVKVLQEQTDCLSRMQHCLPDRL
jgi:transglutaminase-like putative cysteine protease